MTYREKLAKEHPECISDEFSGGAKGCPYDYGYERREDDPCRTYKGYNCISCWNREMPEAEKPHIKDSGERREFASGAVRDIQEGKGRCDLMPLRVVAQFMGGRSDNESRDAVIDDIGLFQQTGDTEHLYYALDTFCKVSGWRSTATLLLEVAKHFEEGAKKYGENNWRRGLPVYCYIDSAVRHYLKWLRGDKDEPHDRAFVWNLMCCIWEVDYSPRAGEKAQVPEEVVTDILRGDHPEVELKSDVHTVLYRCDGKACAKCDPSNCSHTSDIRHAVNFNAFGPTFIEKATESDEDDIQSEENDKWVRLGDCPIGLFEFDGVLYTKIGAAGCVRIDTGKCEFFDPDILVWRIDIQAEGDDS